MRTPRLLSLFALLLAFIPLPIAAQQKSTSATGWVQTKKTEPGGEASQIQFTLAGKFLTRPQRDPGTPPTLVMMCHPRGSRGRFISASVNVGAPLAVQYVEPEEIKAGMSYYPKVEVHYRLDDSKEEKAQWTPGSDKASVSLPKDEVKKMLAAHTAQFTVAENRAGEITMQFDIPDSTQVETVCDLPARKK